MQPAKISTALETAHLSFVAAISLIEKTEKKKDLEVIDSLFFFVRAIKWRVAQYHPLCTQLPLIDLQL